MDKKRKHQFLLVAFGVTLYAGLMNLGTVVNYIIGLCRLVSPVFIGFVLAFILNVPMAGFEKILSKFFRKGKHPMQERAVRFISLMLTLICVALVIALVCTLLIPEVVRSVKSLYDLVLEKWPSWVETLKKYNIDTTRIAQWAESFNFEEFINSLTSSAGSIISSAVGIASSAVSGVTSAFMAFIIAVYVLLGKKDLGRQIKKLSAALIKDSFSQRIFHIAGLVSDTYSKFLSGQCVEACILGALMTVVFSLFRIPYASLIGVLAGVFAFIPYVGAFLACAIGAFLVLLAEPSKVFMCIIVYLVVQFIENQFIYPHVVGTSVGLGAMWTLIAVFVGGNLMGLFGMIFFIPLTAVLVTLLREYTDKIIRGKSDEAERDPGK